MPTEFISITPEESASLEALRVSTLRVMNQAQEVLGLINEFDQPTLEKLLETANPDAMPNLRQAVMDANERLQAAKEFKPKLEALEASAQAAAKN